MSSRPEGDHRFEALRLLGHQFEALGDRSERRRIRLGTLLATAFVAVGLAGGLAWAELGGKDRPIESVPPADRIEAVPGSCEGEMGSEPCIIVTPSGETLRVDPDANPLRGRSGGIPIPILRELCHALPEHERASSPTCQSAKSGR